MNILAIETSCDETSAAIVEDGKKTLSSIVSSQIEFHEKYGGVVPEIASRKHVETINAVIQQALDKAKLTFKKLDAIAVTYGPGLVGALLVGISSAKALALALNKPLIPINHLEGHIYANFIIPDSNPPAFPFICLMVSGGHTLIVLVEDHGKYKILGRTLDDAAGEAFDKVARYLNLGYPGGPIIDKLAKKGDPQAINFPRGMTDASHGLNFSFSGIKTAVINYVKKNQDNLAKTEDIAASFQQAVVDVLVNKTIQAALDNNIKTISLAGGVAANSMLREQMAKKCQENKIKTILPPLSLCTDNAAMIATAAYYRFRNKNYPANFQATASLSL